MRWRLTAWIGGLDGTFFEIILYLRRLSQAYVIFTANHIARLWNETDQRISG